MFMSKKKMAAKLYTDKAMIFLKQIKLQKRQGKRDTNMLPFGAMS